MHLCTMHSLINRLLHATLARVDNIRKNKTAARIQQRRPPRPDVFYAGGLRAALGNWAGKRQSHGWRCTGRAREQCVQLLPTFVHAAQPAGVHGALVGWQLLVLASDLAS